MNGRQPSQRLGEQGKGVNGAQGWGHLREQELETFPEAGERQPAGIRDKTAEQGQGKDCRAHKTRTAMTAVAFLNMLQGYGYCH